MLSLKDIATVKTVVELCNHPDLKSEILGAPGSYYDRNKRNSIEGNNFRWYEIVEEKATLLIENLGIAKQLQEKIMSLIFLVGMRMLVWAEYLEYILGLSREFILKFLNISFFTPQGIIDSKKAAEKLIKDESLNSRQKYKLASLYCFENHIPVLFSQLTTEDKKDIVDSPASTKQLMLVRFWSYYLMDNIDCLTRGINTDHYRLELAVKSGNKTAVEYSLKKINSSTKRIAVIDAAVEAVRCRILAEQHTDKDWVFQNPRCRNDETSWVPSDDYTDILCFLLSEMIEEEQIEFFKKDIEFECEREIVWTFRFNLDFMEGLSVSVGHPEKLKFCFIVLEYFLNWPYQNHFMEKAKLMWEFLSGKFYAVLLLMICDKIESNVLFSNFGEGKSFDYRQLLKEFWCQSPDRCKRQVFCDGEVSFRDFKRVKPGVGLLIKLLSLKKFSHEDGEIIKMILSDATAEEKEAILSSEEWRLIFFYLMEKERWDTLDRYLLHCFLSKEEESEFRRELSFSKNCQSICIDFVKNGNWIAAETFMKWSSLPEEEMKKLKKEMIYSDYGLQSCVQEILSDKVKAGEFVRWYLPSEEEVKTFKKELIFTDSVTDKCISFVEYSQILIENYEQKAELLTEFLDFCLSSETEDRELKKEIAYRYGGIICKDLISAYEIADNYQSFHEVINKAIRFKGGKWEEVQKFLTSYFSSEEEVTDFKKNKLLKEYGEEIHFQLIKSSQWAEAKTFFAWLDLSAEEIKELKKRTLFDHHEAWEMLTDLIYSEDDERYSNKQEAIELLLRWYLTDMQMALEFQDKFFEDADQEDEHVKNLVSIIEQLLRDLGNENMMEVE